MSLNVIMQKLKLDSHHKMERFSVLFCFFIFMIGLLFAISFKIHLDHQKITLDRQALYTEKSAWSLTGQKVKVIDIYRNNDSSKIFILIQTGNGPGDMANMSIDANDYRIFMTGFRGEKLTNNPRAAFYVFGNTGYMGLYFVDSRGFDPHMYDIVVRNTKVLTTDIDPGAAAQYDDGSFADYNQIRLYANFAGTDATVASFLNKDQPTVQEVYAECIASISETPIRTQLDEDLLLMNNQMNLANQYAAQITSYGIRIPELPVSLVGDSITLDKTLTADNPVAFDKEMVNSRGNMIQSEYNTTVVSDSVQFDCVASKDIRTFEPGQAVSNDSATSEDGEQTGTEEEKPKDENAGRLYLVTDFVFPGGYQFNYQDVTLMDSSLAGLQPDGMSFAQWSESKMIEQQTYTTIKSGFDKSYYNVWYRDDGSEYTYNEDLALDADKAVQQALTNYSETIANLYTTKYKYQTKDLYEFLKLKASSDTSDLMFSINTNDNVLTMYES